MLHSCGRLKNSFAGHYTSNISLLLTKFLMKHQILIIGGGNAGLSTASKLLLKNRNLDIAIIEPSDKHYYQPAWTLVGGGAFEEACALFSRFK